MYEILGHGRSAIVALGLAALVVFAPVQAVQATPQEQRPVSASPVGAPAFTIGDSWLWTGRQESTNATQWLDRVTDHVGRPTDGTMTDACMYGMPCAATESTTAVNYLLRLDWSAWHQRWLALYLQWLDWYQDWLDNHPIILSLRQQGWQGRVLITHSGPSQFDHVTKDIYINPHQATPEIPGYDHPNLVAHEACHAFLDLKGHEVANERFRMEYYCYYYANMMYVPADRRREWAIRVAIDALCRQFGCTAEDIARYRREATSFGDPPTIEIPPPMPMPE